MNNFRLDQHQKVLKILDLGSGKNNSIPNAITIDKNPVTSSDITHDLNNFPWPFDSDFFDVIHCGDILEHLYDVVKTMEEIFRIAKNGARVNITTPHFSCANSYTDPTHFHHFGLFSFDYFTGENQWDYYTQAKFKKLKRDLIFYPNIKNKLIWRIAKKYPSFYEENLTWIFPAWYMSFELEVLK